MTPFGDDGPWAKFEGSDLIHLALGGVMMNCGYDPDPSLHYDLPRSRRNFGTLITSLASSYWSAPPPRCSTGCAPVKVRTSPARCPRPYRRTLSSI
jgi:hypothetical protein